MCVPSQYVKFSSIPQCDGIIIKVGDSKNPINPVHWLPLHSVCNPGPLAGAWAGHSLSLEQSWCQASREFGCCLEIYMSLRQCLLGGFSSVGTLS